jgi:hypothetical protein
MRSGWRDLNPQECRLTGFQGQRVCQFRHTRLGLEGGEGLEPSVTVMRAPLRLSVSPSARVSGGLNLVLGGTGSGRHLLLSFFRVIRACSFQPYFEKSQSIIR